MDEIFSVVSARGSLQSLMSSVRSDVVHPPLAYVVLHGWMRVGGESLIWLRLLPSVLACLSVVPAWAIYRQLGLDNRGRITALLLLATGNYTVFHARYVRMYALLLLLSGFSIALFNMYLERGTRRRAVALSAVNLLLVYTHYFGALLAAGQGLYLLARMRRRLPLFAAGSAAAGLLTLPWLVEAVGAAVSKGGLGPNLGWIARPRLFEPIWFYAGLISSVRWVPVGVLALVLIAGALGFSVFRRRRCETAQPASDQVRFAEALVVFAPLCAFTISHCLQQSVWGSRHLVIVAIPFTGLLARAIWSLPWRFRRTALGAVVGLAFLSSVASILDPEPRNNVHVLARQLIELHTRENPSGEKIIYSADSHLAFPLGFFLKNETGSEWRFEALSPPERIDTPVFWVALNHKSWRFDKDPHALMRGLGYEIGPGVWAGDQWDRLSVFLVYRR